MFLLKNWTLDSCSQNTKPDHTRKNQRLRKKNTYLRFEQRTKHDKVKPDAGGRADFYCPNSLSGMAT